MRKSIEDPTAALQELRTGPDASAGIGQQEIFYCWSHGITSGQHHISNNCCRHQEGNKEDATYNNKRGGSNFCSMSARRR
eukprot:10219360-Ditylum_brightwellii.AAC.1